MTKEDLFAGCCFEFSEALRLSLAFRHFQTANQRYGGWLWVHTYEFSHYACLWAQKLFDELNIHSKLQDIVEEFGGEYLRHEDTSVFVRWPK